MSSLNKTFSFNFDRCKCQYKFVGSGGPFMVAVKDDEQVYTVDLAELFDRLDEFGEAIEKTKVTIENCKIMTWIEGKNGGHKYSI